MIHEIRIAPHPALREVAEPVETVDDEILTLLDDMAETMYDAPGIGLAATQIGIAKRLVVIDLSGGREGEAAKLYKMINPEVIEASEETVIQEEGCLSLPAQYADVERPATVTVRYTDENGETQEVKGDGLMSACLQHEIDHLDGKLFIDYISSLRRRLIMKSLKKHLREQSRR